MNVLKVGIDARFFLKENNNPHGHLLYNLLKHNKDQNHPFDYFLFTDKIYNKQKLLDMQADNLSIIVVENTNNFSEYYFYFITFTSVIKRINLDFFISPYYRVPLIPKTRCINMIHDVSFFVISKELLPTKFQSNWKRMLVFIGFWLYCRFSNCTITVSQFSKKQIVQKLNLSQKKVNVIYNPYPYKGCIDGVFVDEENQKNDFGDYILFVGTNQRKKNITSLIEAFNEFTHSPYYRDGTKLLLKTSQSSDLQNKIKEYNLVDKVLILDGYMSEIEMRTLYSNASILCLPSYHEGFGIPVLESMTQGVPVVVSQDSAMAEISGSLGYYINPYNSSSITKAFEDIYALSSEHKEALKEALKEKSMEFSTHKISENFIKLILEKSMPK